MKKFLIILFFLTTYLFLPQNAFAQAGGTFYCEWTGIQCVANLSGASCIAGYHVNDGACSGIGDMFTCQGTFNIPCEPNPTPAGTTLCYACVTGSCTLVDPNSFGSCPYANTSAGLTSCNAACGGAPPPTGQKFKCVSGTCELATDGTYDTGVACELACNPPAGSTTSPSVANCGGQSGFQTAIGCIPVESPQAFATFFLQWGMGIAGGIALALIGYAGIMILTSAGNPQKLQAGKELLTSAISGLLLLLFGAFALRLIGVEILRIPTFGQ